MLTNACATWALVVGVLVSVVVFPETTTAQSPLELSADFVQVLEVPSCLPRRPDWATRTLPDRKYVLEASSHESSQLVTQLVAIWMRDVMGYDVEVREYSGGMGLSMARLAAGVTDLAMDVDAFGIGFILQYYVQLDPPPIHLGANNYLVQAGLFVDAETVAANPSFALDYWASFRNPSVLALFPPMGSTPGEDLPNGLPRCSAAQGCVLADNRYIPMQCALGGPCVEVLSTSPLYSNLFLERLIDGLSLNMSVTYVSKETLWGRVQSRKNASLPVLFQWRTPSSQFFTVDPTEIPFSRVLFPSDVGSCHTLFESDLNRTLPTTCDFGSVSSIVGLRSDLDPKVAELAYASEMHATILNLFFRERPLILAGIIDRGYELPCDDWTCTGDWACLLASTDEMQTLMSSVIPTPLPQFCATPTFSVASGAMLTEDTVVFLSSTTTGAEFYFTLDGSIPTGPGNGTLYDPRVGIPLTRSEASRFEVRAVATADYWEVSPVASAFYEFEENTSDQLQLILIASGAGLVFLVCSGIGLYFVHRAYRTHSPVWKVNYHDIEFQTVIGAGATSIVYYAHLKGVAVAAKVFSVGKDGRVRNIHAVGGMGSSGDPATNEALMSSFGGSRTASRHSRKVGPVSSQPDIASRLGISAASATSFLSSDGASTEEGTRKSSRGGRKMRVRKMRKTFLSEAATLSDLRHPNVVLFMGAAIGENTATNCLEFVMLTEVMEQGSLYDIIHNATLELPMSLRMRCLTDAAKGLQFLHSHDPPIIHNDVKSLNILVDGSWRCKIADFGMASLEMSDSQNKGTVSGTWQWLAPERLLHQAPATVQTDSYSFAVVIWELVVRAEPHEGLQRTQVVAQMRQTRDDHAEFTPHFPIPRSVDPAIQELVRQGTSHTIKKRPSMLEYVMRLERLMMVHEDLDAREAELNEQHGTLSEDQRNLLLTIYGAEALRQDISLLPPKAINGVTVLFSDIVGYTQLSANMDPVAVADMLHRLYSKFDQIARVREVTKIETIGDAYLVIGGIRAGTATTASPLGPTPSHTPLAGSPLASPRSQSSALESDGGGGGGGGGGGNQQASAYAVARMAFDMIEAARQTPISLTGTPPGSVEIRVGLHIGAVVASIAGTTNRKLTFVGDTVNTAARMESNGLPNCVNISPDLFRTLLQDPTAAASSSRTPRLIKNLEYEKRAAILVKGKGKMSTYLLRPPRDVAADVDALDLSAVLVEHAAHSSTRSRHDSVRSADLKEATHPMPAASPAMLSRSIHAMSAQGIGRRSGSPIGSPKRSPSSRRRRSRSSRGQVYASTSAVESASHGAGVGL